MKRTVFMAIDNSDKYQLPFAIADSAKELSRKLGLSRDAVASEICHSRQKGRKNPRYIKVEYEDDEEI